MIDPNAAVFDYWLQQIHAMTHRQNPPSAPPRLSASMSSLLLVEREPGQVHPFRAAFAERKQAFRQRWVD